MRIATTAAAWAVLSLVGCSAQRVGTDTAAMRREDSVGAATVTVDSGAPVAGPANAAAPSDTMAAPDTGSVTPGTGAALPDGATQMPGDPKTSAE